MSEPTLTDEQREGEGALCGCGHRVMWHHDKRGCQYHGNGLDRCPCSLTSDAVVAAMLADERAAREAAEAEAAEWRETATSTRKWALGEIQGSDARAEAAEAKVRDLTASMAALADSWEACDRFAQFNYGEDPRGRDYSHVVRARLDDPAAALAEVRAETLRNQRDFFKAIDMPAAADHCEQSAIGWDSSADDARRSAEAEGAGR